MLIPNNFPILGTVLAPPLLNPEMPQKRSSFVYICINSTPFREVRLTGQSSGKTGGFGDTVIYPSDVSPMSKKNSADGDESLYIGDGNRPELASGSQAKLVRRLETLKTVLFYWVYIKPKTLGFEYHAHVSLWGKNTHLIGSDFMMNFLDSHFSCPDVTTL